MFKLPFAIRTVGRLGNCALFGIALALLTSDDVTAQSGTRYPGGGSIATPQRTYQVQPGSTSRVPSGTPTQGTLLALSGYCPVSIIDVKQWVRGDSQFRTEYDGKAYYFPNADMQQTFLANPGKYVPALGGDCTVCLAKTGQRMPGSVYYAAYYQGRLYLFPDDAQQQVFVANPAEFADTDLAMNGMCAVCKVELGQDIPGDPQFAAFHDGMRYLFPGEDHLKRFLADPQKYASKELQ